jgi:predicted metalloprotease
MVLRMPISGSILVASNRRTVRQNTLAISSYNRRVRVTRFVIAGILLLAGLLCCAQTRPADKELRLVSFVLDDVQKTWDRILPAQTGVPYHHAKLDLYRRSLQSACGIAQTSTGPFYCPGDEKVYLDLEFFDELKRRFGAPGEFAQAYVIAHEIGHHVQKLLGILKAGRSSIPIELQADCLAGVWAHSTEERNLVNGTDINAAMRAAAAVGDDRLQRETRGYVNPETFTHGTSAQRVAAFRRGLDSGKVAACRQ